MAQQQQCGMSWFVKALEALLEQEAHKTGKTVEQIRKEISTAIAKSNNSTPT